MCQINEFTFLHGDGSLQLNYTGTVLFLNRLYLKYYVHTKKVFTKRDIIVDYCEKKVSSFKNHTETVLFITIKHITPISTQAPIASWHYDRFDVL